MRASVDNPELLKLFGGKPDQVAALSWMIGISLAGLGGILLVSTVGLDTYSLTLLVINAYAAAMLGRLKSLPLTFVGAMGLGLLTSYAPVYLPQRRAAGPGQERRAGAVPVRRHHRDAPGPAADRPGQGHRLGAAPVAARRPLGWGAGLLVVVALLVRLDVRGQPAARRHRGDVRDRDAVAGAAHRLRRPRLAGAVHLRRRRRAGLRQARRAQPLRTAALGADRGRRRRAWWRCRCCG